VVAHSDIGLDSDPRYSQFRGYRWHVQNQEGKVSYKVGDAIGCGSMVKMITVSLTNLFLGKHTKLLNK